MLVWTRNCSILDHFLLWWKVLVIQTFPISTYTFGNGVNPHGRWKCLVKIMLEDNGQKLCRHRRSLFFLHQNKRRMEGKETWLTKHRRALVAPNSCQNTWISTFLGLTYKYLSTPTMHGRGGKDMHPSHQGHNNLITYTITKGSHHTLKENIHEQSNVHQLVLAWC